MKYIVDTNVFIPILNYYYEDIFITFWEKFNELVKENIIISVRDVYKELEKMKPIRFWKCALVFIDYMDKNYDEIIHKVSTNYDTTKMPYNRISMMRHNSYRELNEVIKRGIFSALNFKYKECSNKEVLQLLDHFKENKYVHLMLCFLAFNYSKELYILGCTSAAVYESIGDDLDEEMEELVNG